MKKEFFVTYLYNDGLLRSGSGTYIIDSIPPSATQGQIAWELQRRVPFCNVTIINFWEM